LSHFIVGWKRPRNLQKPDVTAADGVTTDVPGSFAPFYGTSAAAPQVAGIAALMWSKDRSLTADQIKSALRKSAIQIGDSKEEWNQLSGFGVVNAEAALRYIETVKSKPSPETSSRDPERETVKSNAGR
jgi:subtilisin family serine protease